ncbi:MAG: penicillin-binding transpeptidase domain-containing protein [Dethiobacteria bacterium]|jgi:stage V sporulation protein D (sporulation-specific penicillin-binding protein)
MARDVASNLFMRKRLLIIFLLTTVLILGLIVRLGWIQLVMAEELQQKAWEQWNRSIPARSSRGDIFDRNGKLLASSATVETVVAIPPQIEDPHLTAKALAPILEMSEEELYELVTQQRAAVYLKRKVEDEVAKEIRLLNLPGINFAQETKRVYPNGTLLSQLLGFVGMDQGWGGLEIYYEDILKGRDGNFVFPTDNLGREVPGVRRLIPPKEGKNLVLTIDETIQFIVERELAKAMLEYEPERIQAIAVNPKTGEVLAASSKPDFNPNNYSDYNKEFWRLFPVTDTFEPGSTFKLITLAAAIEENLYCETDPFFCSGASVVAGQTVRCWTSGQGGHGSINFLEAVLSSCNPAFMNLGEKLGVQKLFEYIRAFGFGTRTGIDYPGEGTGLIFSPEQVGPLELATTSFGQGVSVTPLQQVMAVSAIANGGYLMRPYIVKEITDSEHQTIEKREPEIIRQVISNDTSKRIISIMEKVVEEGSGSNAIIEGYRIAGKTGTAQKVGPDGFYVGGKYILSFIGFAPVEDPQILLYIAVDGVKRGPQWGSQVSAPLFRDIMQDVLSYLEIAPAKALDEGEISLLEVPQLKGLTVDEIGALLDTKGLKVKVVGSEGVIVDQTPKAGAKIPMHTNIIVYLEDLWPEEEPEKILIPALQGMTIKEAGEILARLGLQLEATGTGIAFEQEPSAGTPVSKNTVVKVNFSPPLH